MNNILQSTPLYFCQLEKLCICAEFLDTKLSETQILRLPKVSQPKHECQARYVIMVNYIPRFNFVHRHPASRAQASFFLLE